ncbi:hypothetical protein VULLAG_LOCUS15988 [Vulpes lagopus]
MSWMREGVRGRSGARRDWPGIARARLADRHFTSCGGGGGGRRDGFLQGKKARPREAQISCRRGLAGGRAGPGAEAEADAAGPSQDPFPPPWNDSGTEQNPKVSSQQKD